MTLSFDLSFNSVCDQNKISCFCNDLQVMLHRKMKEIARAEVKILEFQYGSEIISRDIWQISSGNEDSPVLLLHLDCSGFVDETKFEESIETVNKCSKWANVLRRKVILMGRKEMDLCKFFIFHLCIFFSFMPNVCNDGNSQPGLPSSIDPNKSKNLCCSLQMKEQKPA